MLPTALLLDHSLFSGCGPRPTCEWRRVLPKAEDCVGTPVRYRHSAVFEVQVNVDSDENFFSAGHRESAVRAGNKLPMTSASRAATGNHR